MNEDYTTIRKIMTWVTMLNNCLHPWMVIDVLADECDEAVANTLVKDLSIDEVFGDVIDALTEVLMKVLGVDMLDSDPIILVAETMIASLFVVSISYARDVLAGDWTTSLVKSIGGVRIEAVVETLGEAIIICVFGVLADVDANVLPANTIPLEFVTVSS